MYTAHWPRLHPSDFRVKTLDGVADDWPIDYDSLAPFFAENDRMMGVSGLSGDPGSPPTEATDAAAAARPLRRDPGQGHEQARLALVAVDTTVATTDYEGRARCINLGHCTPACAQGAKPQPTSPIGRRRCAPASSCARIAGARDHDQRGRHGPPASFITTRMVSRQFQPAEVVIHRLQRHRHAAAAIEFGVRPIFPTDSQFQRAGRQEPDVSSYAQVYGYVEEPTDSNRAPPTCLWSKEFYDTDPRATSCAAMRSSSAAAPGPCSKPSRARPRASCHGEQITTASSASSTATAAASAICEDLPEEHNRVTLDPVLKDSHGIAAPRVDYTISENSAKMMEHGIARAKQVLAAAGATDTV